MQEIVDLKNEIIEYENRRRYFSINENNSLRGVYLLLSRLFSSAFEKYPSPDCPSICFACVRQLGVIFRGALGGRRIRGASRGGQWHIIFVEKKTCTKYSRTHIP